jgi:hypothetical protein
MRSLLAMLGVVVFLAANSPGPTCAEDPKWEAHGFERKTIYHSPQKPGFTCWVGAWVMPEDKSLMISFVEATGPVEGRSPAPVEVQARTGWPYPSCPKDWPADKWDFSELDQHLLYLRSTDEGKTWKEVARDPFHAQNMEISQGGAQAVLRDGSILRGIWGYITQFNPELPKAAYVQRSTDGAKTWGTPVTLIDSAKENTRITRFRRLKDGRLLALGGRARIPYPVTMPVMWPHFEPLLIASNDDGKTWEEPVDFLSPEQRKGWGCEEWDAAELENGDLLGIFRRFDPVDAKRQVRWQGHLKKKGNGWVAEKLGPSVFPHSGHPELFATQEGVILHVATSGIHWTADGGENWKPVVFPDVPKGFHPPQTPESLQTNYYPKTVQADDGTIYVFTHVGSDNAYGGTDQRIVMDKFRLRENKGSTN